LGKGEALYLANETLIFRNFHIRSNLFLSCANQNGSFQKKSRVGIGRYPINMTHKERGKGEIEPHIVLAMILYISKGLKKLWERMELKRTWPPSKG
jgi:hypothetical protein